MGCTYVYLATWKCMICFNNFSLFDREPTNAHTHAYIHLILLFRNGFALVAFVGTPNEFQCLCPLFSSLLTHWRILQKMFTTIFFHFFGYWEIGDYFTLSFFHLRSARKSPFCPLKHYYFLFIKLIEIEKWFMPIQQCEWIPK